MRLTLHVWRQPGPELAGVFVRYDMTEVSPDMSFLEMLDVLNQQLLARKDDPIAFDHDCREGICGMCGMVINGRPHGPQRATTTCQLHMRSFPDGAELWIEPWRAGAFPVIKDLVVDRIAFDRIIQAGGFITARTGSAPEANTLLVPKRDADRAMDAAACIGCGACVAQMDAEGFGACTNHGECMAACPKEISIDFIAQLNRDYWRAVARPKPQAARANGGDA